MMNLLLVMTIAECESIITTVNPQFEPRVLINFMAQNHPGSNRERVENETLLQ